MGRLSIEIPRLFRRAILIYLLTIVFPVCILLWLGIRSFDRQREALATLTAEKLAVAIDTRTRDAAALAFQDPSHPLATHFFRIEHGEMVRPALRAPLPARPSPAFLDAERLESTRPDLALAAYRRLAGGTDRPGLALSRVARCLTALGRADEASTTWRNLARAFPDERDLSGRPFGIVAAIQAGETTGLLQQIAAERWQLSADHAEYFVGELGPGQADAYLDRFRFARELVVGFRPPGGLRELDLRSETVAGRRIFYRMDPDGGLAGFAANESWIDGQRAQVQAELGVADPQARDLRLHAGAVALVSLLLSAGVLLLARDSSREARINDLRTAFVSGVSHELKTPITLVRLYGETLLRHEGLSPDERRDFYRIITRESARLGRLVDQILSFSRIEQGELKYDMKEGDLAPLVAGVVEDYREWLEHAGFVVRRTMPDAAPTVVFDPVAVSQALVNLLDNAAKYSGSSREIAVRLDARPGHVSVEVADHGIGIPPAEQARIFDRFYRSGGATGKGGYGLGLFMVSHIMAVHGGRVEVDSERGRGSRFRLIFPTTTA
jgi:signal transduction histidine kinase